MSDRSVVEIERDGQAAWGAGSPRWYNPHPIESREAVAWAAGWLRAADSRPPRVRLRVRLANPAADPAFAPPLPLAVPAHDATPEAGHA